MANNLQAFTPTKYSLKLIAKLWNETLYNKIANTDYEGEIKKEGDKVVVRTEQDITLNTYTKGMTLVAQDLTPTSEELVVDQQKYFKFIVDDIDKLQNDIKTIDRHADNGRRQMAVTIDTDLFSYMYKEAHGDNYIGTDEATGTVAVAATTGVVTGTGTTFTAQMVNMPFKADGHTGYYRVSTFTSTTSITIEDYDAPGTYSGGAISSGATFVVKAASAVSVTKTNVYQKIVELGEVLDERLCPMENRCIVINAKMKSRLLQAPEFIPAVDRAYNDVVKGANIGMIGNFMVYQSELIAGDNTDGYFIVAGDKGYVSFAMQIMKVSVVDSAVDPNSFTSTCKGLVTWGRKVFAGTRARGAVLRATFA